MEPVARFQVPNKYRRDLARFIAIVVVLSILGAAGIWLVDFSLAAGATLSETSLHCLLSVLVLGVGAFLVGLSLIDIRSVLWHDLTLTQNSLTWRKPGRELVISLGEVERIGWYPNQHRSEIRLLTADGSHRVPIAMFDPADRLTLIRFFRRRFSDVRQDRWSEFCRAYAISLQARREPELPLRPGEYYLRRRRFDMIFSLGTIVAALMAVVLWWLTGESRKLWAALSFLPLWAIVRYAWPKRGMKVTPAPGDGPFFAAIGFGYLGPFVVLVVAAGISYFADERFPVQEVFLASVALAPVPAWIIHRRYRASGAAWRQRRDDEAAAEWDRLEAANG